MSSCSTDLELLLGELFAIGDVFGLSRTELSEIIGTDFGATDRSLHVKAGVAMSADQVRAGQRLLLLHDNLTALVGDDEATVRSWLRTRNVDLGARPIDLIKNSAGLDSVSNYVGSYRHRS